MRLFHTIKMCFPVAAALFCDIDGLMWCGVMNWWLYEFEQMNTKKKGFIWFSI